MKNTAFAVAKAVFVFKEIFQRELRHLVEALNSLAHTIVVYVLLGCKGGRNSGVIAEGQTRKSGRAGIELLAKTTDGEREGIVGARAYDIHHGTGVFVVVIFVF